MDFVVKSIGRVRAVAAADFFIEVDGEYRPALSGLEGFSHINVFFWCDRFDSHEARAVRQTPRPYRLAPDTLGIFSTRSPVRPNPLGLTACRMLGLDGERGRVDIAYIDADDGTPVIDIKPYTPCLDRVREVCVPEWCGHWPKWQEESGDFNWADELVY